VFFTAGLTRVLIEVALLGAILLIILPRAIEQPPIEDLSLEAFIITAFCGLWGALRFGRDTRSVTKYLAALAVGAAVTAGMLAVILLYGKWSLLTEDELGPPRLILIFLTTSFMYVIFRALILFWLRWNRMRKQRLIWSFTHMQMVIVLILTAAGAVVFTINAMIQVSLQREPKATIGQFLLDVATEVVPVLGPVVGGSIFLLLILIPPLGLLSYLLVRDTIRRLEDLVAGTAALREGDLSTRIEVSGEDEVAQLQGDFNKMAADLEGAIADLEQERDRVTGLLRVQHELTAAVSHELRTPVATIQGYLQPALARTERAADSDIHKDLVIINAEVRRLQKLIDDLFALSRAEVEQLTLVIEPTDVSAVVRRIVDVWQPLSWRQRRVDVICQPEPGDHIALVDANRLEQILTNLVHNAVRHTPPGGIVAVVVGSDDEWVEIDVRDTGEGISAEELPFVWEPFYRGEGDGDHDDGRTGLGLAVVKSMTEAMGGNVQVESQIDQGSCFEVRLPMS
jgi:signal transduction histidine kinase